MAKIGDIKEMFNGIEGFQIIEDDSGNIQDVILPPTCKILSKSIVDGVLHIIQFRKDDALYTYVN